MSLRVNHIFMFKDGKQFTSIDSYLFPISLSVFVVSIFILQAINQHNKSFVSRT